MLRRTITAAGNPANYLGYVFLLSVWYFLYNTFLVASTSPLQPAVVPIVGFAYILVLNPFVLAGLYWSIYQQQKTQGESGVGEFLANGWRNYLRIVGANFVYFLSLYASAIVISLALHTEASDRVLSYVDIPGSAIALFWFASVVAEGGVLRSLGRALRVLLSNPLALALGVFWGVWRLADDRLVEWMAAQNSLVVNGADAALLALMRVLTAVYAVALYRQIRGEALAAQDVPAMQAVPDSPEAVQARGNALVNTSFGFGLASFIPLAHFVALVLGILAIRRSGRLSIRSSLAIGLGGFFTAVYALAVAALLIGPSPSLGSREFGWLAARNPVIADQVALLDQGSWEQARSQLEPIKAAASGGDWTIDSAIAIARWGSNDMDGAMQSFSSAAQAQPDRSEFYYFYGLALLDNNQAEQAAAQFRNAALHAPALVQPARYTSLLDAAYTPPQEITIAFTIIILLILFTVHEYGHALIAWKLGDDTARSQGRLTLNPIAHLDLFGSILLPAILLWRGSGVVFGWAKPVPVNPANFKDPRRDHMRVSFAGPALNLLVAMLCFVALASLALVLRVLWPETLSWRLVSPYGATALIGPPFARELTIVVVFVKQLMYTSLALGLFNLLPVPPLDGSWILSGLLPGSLQGIFEKIRPLGFVLFLLIAWTPVVDYVIGIPLGVVWSGLSVLISAVGLS